MVEATRLIKAKEGEEDTIAIDESVRFGQDVREIGSDIEKGDTVLRRGDIISAAEIGILSSMGIVNVHNCFVSIKRIKILTSTTMTDQSLRETKSRSALFWK